MQVMRDRKENCQLLLTV